MGLELAIEEGLLRVPFSFSHIPFVAFKVGRAYSSTKKGETLYMQQSTFPPLALNSVQIERTQDMNAKVKAFVAYMALVVVSAMLYDCQSAKTQYLVKTSGLYIPQYNPEPLRLEPQPVPAATTAKPKPKKAAIDHTAKYTKKVVTKYKQVAKAEARAVVKYSMKYATKYNLEPTLLLGLIAAESSFKASVVSPMGAVGYTQVVPRYHQDKIKGRNITDPDVNIQVGAKILRDCLDTHRSRKRALGCYNGVRDPRGIERYAKHVLKHVELFS